MPIASFRSQPERFFGGTKGKTTRPSSYPCRSENNDFVLLGFFAFSVWAWGLFRVDNLKDKCCNSQCFCFDLLILKKADQRWRRMSRNPARRSTSPIKSG
jgi:hypothetical protein